MVHLAGVVHVRFEDISQDRKPTDPPPVNHSYVLRTSSPIHTQDLNFHALIALSAFGGGVGIDRVFFSVPFKLNAFGSDTLGN